MKVAPFLFLGGIIWASLFVLGQENGEEMKPFQPSPAEVLPFQFDEPDASSPEKETEPMYYDWEEVES